MAIEESSSQVLEYLKKQKEANTFRIARELSIDRHKIINIVRDLEEKGSVHVKSGKVVFLKFPKVEKEAKKPIKVILQKPAITASVLDNLQAENKIFNVKIISQAEEIEKLYGTIKELQSKAETPKIIKRTIVKNIIKEVPAGKPIRFKIPEFLWIKNIAELNKNIQQLNIPEILKKGG